MEKDIYTLLNEVETDLSGYEEKPLSEWEMKRMKKQFKKTNRLGNSFKKAAVAACIAAVGVVSLGSVFNEEVYAAMKRATYNINKLFQTDNNLEDYVTVLNSSKTDNGYTITLNEVMLDRDSLIVSSTIKSDEKLPNDGITADAGVYVNGVRVDVSSGGGTDKADDYTYEQAIAYNINNLKPADILDVELRFKSIQGADGTETKGDWSFRFKADSKALEANTSYVAMDQTITFSNGQQIKLTEYSSNDALQKIYFDILTEHIGMKHDVVLRGQDDLGNPVEFYLSSANKSGGIFEISGIDNGIIQKDASQLTLTPYSVAFPEKSGKMSSDYKVCGEAFVINLK